jgi:Rrf2 family nitric oxide-sensitive transcriptional repressor
MLPDRFEHGLRLMVLLCRRAPDLLSLQELTDLSKLPREEVEDLLKSMHNTGLVKKAWGSLRSDRDITLYDVLTATAQLRRITSCPLGFVEHGANLCPLHRTLDNALGALEVAFRRTTIHHILNQPQTSRPLCRFAAAETAQIPGLDPGH